MDYLASYEGSEGKSYALPTISWYIDQTLGGAVSTDTHGSSLKRYASCQEWRQSARHTNLRICTHTHICALPLSRFICPSVSWQVHHRALS